MFYFGISIANPIYQPTSKNLFGRRYFLGTLFKGDWIAELELYRTSNILEFEVQARISGEHIGFEIQVGLFNRVLSLLVYDNLHADGRPTREEVFEAIGFYLGRKTKGLAESWSKFRHKYLKNRSRY
jgi:hypothetical protein